MRCLALPSTFLLHCAALCCLVSLCAALRCHALPLRACTSSACCWLSRCALLLTVRFPGRVPRLPGGDAGVYVLRQLHSDRGPILRVPHGLLHVWHQGSLSPGCQRCVLALLPRYLRVPRWHCDMRHQICAGEQQEGLGHEGRPCVHCGGLWGVRRHHVQSGDLRGHCGADG